MTPVASTAMPFVRDRFTWSAYFLLAYYAYLQASLGPLMVFLREELRLNYTVSGFHLSAFALGMVLAGLGGERFAARWGRSTIFWAGGGGMAAGAVLLALGQTPFITVAATLIMGFVGSLLLVMIQATLADRHGNRRASALTESNLAASMLAGLAPLAVGLGQAVGLGWRSALFAGAGIWVVLVATFRNEPIPSEGQVTHRIDGASDVSLSPVFYLYWLVIFFSVSVEWCMVFWGASFLEDVVGLNKAIASSTMFVFFLAVVAGRVGGSWLVRVVRSERLLILAIGLVLIGFPCFWLGEFALLNVVGLFIVGLGVANLFPLGLSAASSTGHAHSNKVSARISLAAGAAILVVPQGLGAAADQIGVQNAYAVVAVFSVLSAIMIVIAFRVATR